MAVRNRYFGKTETELCETIAFLRTIRIQEILDAHREDIRELGAENAEKMFSASMVRWTDNVVEIEYRLNEFRKDRALGV